ncbi:MAG: thiamine biosynthesis protein [Thermodesulfobacteriota bacterium]|nr:thiamine biosynthesis protein [Thermodesulfobacteriota bacterium]
MNTQSPNHSITKSLNHQITQLLNHSITKSLNSPTCLVLYSGGLDSILACKILQEQGIHVIALYFITPFFGYKLKGRERISKKKVFADQGIQFKEIDISDVYLKMVKNPKHGYGKYINPCIDCKILMVREAMKILGEFNASFVATGEVLGQRPMSQRRDALRIIERDSGADGLLLRPLSALHLPSTDPENKGLVDRSRLLGLTGRGRKDQIALACKYGIKEYPAPAGGCVLADPILSRRFKRMFELWPEFDVNDSVFAQRGKHFLMPDKSWLVIGRDERENAKIVSMIRKGDIRLDLTAVPGPTGLWRKIYSEVNADLAASILCRYARLKNRPGEVKLSGPGTENIRTIRTMSASDETINRYRM